MLKGVPAFPLRSFLRRRSMGDCTADLLVWLPFFGGDFLDGCETFFAVFKTNFWTLFETHFSFFFFLRIFPSFWWGGGLVLVHFVIFLKLKRLLSSCTRISHRASRHVTFALFQRGKFGSCTWSVPPFAFVRHTAAQVIHQPS